MLVFDLYGLLIRQWITEDFRHPRDIAVDGEFVLVNDASAQGHISVFHSDGELVRTLSLSANHITVHPTLHHFYLSNWYTCQTRRFCLDGSEIPSNNRYSVSGPVCVCVDQVRNTVMVLDYAGNISVFEA